MNMIGIDHSGIHRSMGSPHAEQLIQKAKELQPVLLERAAQCKALRRIPDATIADFQRAGFFKILQSEKYGGYAMDPQVFYTVGLELAKACMSSAWVFAVVGVHNWQLNLFDGQASEDVWSDDPTILISSSYAPVGKVTPVDGGFRLSGRWGFSSGSEHCKWVFLGAVVPTEDQPWSMTNYRTFMLPREDYDIEENWDVVGLQGTGSHDIVVDDKFVPEYRTHKMTGNVNGEKQGAKEPLYCLQFMQVFSRAVCTASLGAVESVLEGYINIAKTRVAGPVAMKNDPSAKKLAANAKAEIEHMKLIMYNNFDRMMEAAHAGTVASLDDRARYRYDTAVVADKCLEISSQLLKAAGSGGIRVGSEMLERHLDILASQAHVANVSEPFAINMGGMLFGQKTTDFSI